MRTLFFASVFFLMIFRIIPPVVDPVVSLPVLLVLRDHTAEVMSCDWIYGAAETLVSGSKDSTIRVWDVATQQSQVEKRSC